MLTNSQIETLAELSLVRALPDMILDRKKINKSRLGNIYKRLQKYTDNIISTFPIVGTLDRGKVHERIWNFATVSGWEKKEHDVIKLLSFILGIIDESDFKYPELIIEELNNAFEHITNDINDDEINGYLAEAEVAVALWKGRNIQEQEASAA